jgi:hypothetical protein
MRVSRLALVVIVGAVAVALAALAGLGHASAGAGVAAPAEYQYTGPPNDLVTGSGAVIDATTGLRDQWRVSAHSGPLGEGPDGSVTYISPFFVGRVAKGRVTCMIVTGNRAQVGGVFDELVADDNLTDFHWFELVIDDNGEPGSGAPDAITPFVFRLATHPPDFDPCSVFLPPLFPLDSGNFTVKDATAP